MRSGPELVMILKVTDSDAPKPPIEVPMSAVSAQALAAMIEEYVLRFGTDYGREEVAHEVKLRQIQKQIEAGSVRIMYDPNLDTVTLITSDEWQRLNRSQS